MTRDNLIEFLTKTYEPNDELVWQTICFEDLENGVDGATPELWEKFVEREDYYGNLATDFSERAFEEFYDFIQENEG